jgi:hypothetical protein
MSSLLAIGQGLNAVKAATDSVKTLLGLHVSAKVLENTVQLNQQILAVQSALMDAQKEQTTLVETIRDTEEENTRLKAWDADKRRYELTCFNPGVFLYTLSQGTANGQPIHHLCARCYEHNQKSILQASTEIRLGKRVRYCPECKTEYAFGPEARAETRQARAATDFDPFSGS